MRFGTHELLTKIVFVRTVLPQVLESLVMSSTSLCQCPTTKVVLGRFTVKFQRLTRLLDLLSLTSFPAEETTRLVLGNPPP